MKPHQVLARLFELGVDISLDEDRAGVADCFTGGGSKRTRGRGAAGTGIDRVATPGRGAIRFGAWASSPYEAAATGRAGTRVVAEHAQRGLGRMVGGAPQPGADGAV